jgi:hypothetical protein
MKHAASVRAPAHKGDEREQMVRQRLGETVGAVASNAATGSAGK